MIRKSQHHFTEALVYIPEIFEDAFFLSVIRCTVQYTMFNVQYMHLASQLTKIQSKSE